MYRKYGFLCSLFILPFLPFGQASAQSTASGAFAIEEIVVTARRREESLQDTPIAVSAFSEEEIPANIDISRCSIINGSEYALSYSGFSTGTILNCNLINSNFGIKLFDYANVVIKNSNLINNTTYGVGIYSTTPILTISYSNAWGNSQDYMENCPG